MLDEQLPLLPGLRTEDGLPVGRLSLLVIELVLDGALQCRTQTDAAVVAAYAELLREGATFPAIRVLRVAGRLLVVDGWHRALAHRDAGRDVIEADVSDGTWSEAVLAAAGANANHGLQRTMEDKRRAVRLLLTDESSAKRSSRELAKIAGVSHTFVDDTRKRYDVKPGQVVTEKRIEQVDGEPAGAWRGLIEAAAGEESYIRTGILTCRAAPDLMALRAARCWGALGAEARTLRERELADKPWPWDDDGPSTLMSLEEPAVVAVRAARAASLDTQEDILRALESWCLPSDCRAALYKALDDLVESSEYALTDIIKRNHGRPAIAARARDLQARRKAKRLKDAGSRPRQSYELAEDIANMTDPLAQVAAVQGCTDEVLRDLRSRSKHLPLGLRNGVLLERVIGDGAYELCPRPSCGAWVWPARRQWDKPSCVACGVEPAEWVKNMRLGIRNTATLLQIDGYGMETTFGGIPGVVVDRAGIRLLQGMQDAVSGALRAEMFTWANKAPAGLREELRAFFKPRVVTFTQHEPAEPVASPAAEDHGNDLPDEPEPAKSAAWLAGEQAFRDGGDEVEASKAWDDKNPDGSQADLGGKALWNASSVDEFFAGYDAAAARGVR